MEELLILLGAIVLTCILAMVKSIRLAPSLESEFELERRADKGDTHARHELNRRIVLPLLGALQRLKVALLIALLFGLLIATHSVWLGMLVGFALLMIVEIVTARGWLAGFVWGLQRKLERHLLTIAYKGAPVFKLWAFTQTDAHAPAVASKAELRQLIDQDQTVLSAAERARLHGALDFATTRISQLMVPRSQIATVDMSETVGPLLMDRLHKAGHKVFPVIKKDLDHIKGLLYMSDLMPLDPDLKLMTDALRPTVHYVPATAHIATVISASLQTGRQLFVAVDENGETQGLITLADVLTHMLGQPPAKEVAVGTKPKQLS